MLRFDVCVCVRACVRACVLVSVCALECACARKAQVCNDYHIRLACQSFGLNKISDTGLVLIGVKPH